MECPVLEQKHFQRPVAPLDVAIERRVHGLPLRLAKVPAGGVRRPVGVRWVEDVIDTLAGKKGGGVKRRGEQQPGLWCHVIASPMDIAVDCPGVI